MLPHNIAFADRLVAQRMEEQANRARRLHLQRIATRDHTDALTRFRCWLAREFSGTLLGQNQWLNTSPCLEPQP